MPTPGRGPHRQTEQAPAAAERLPGQQAVGSPEHDEDDDQAVDDEAIFAGEPQGFRQGGENDGTEHRAGQSLEAAEQQEDDEVQRDEEAKLRGRDHQQVMRLRGSGHADQCAAEGRRWMTRTFSTETPMDAAASGSSRTARAA